MKEKEPAVNKVCRAANIAIAHGVWINGVYRDHGIPRPSKEKRPRSIENSIFNMKGEIIFNGKM